LFCCCLQSDGPQISWKIENSSCTR
jgi:hypothetical protein